jgi:hypothetical protein
VSGTPRGTACCRRAINDRLPGPGISVTNRMAPIAVGS